MTDRWLVNVLDRRSWRFGRWVSGQLDLCGNLIRMEPDDSEDDPNRYEVFRDPTERWRC